MKGLCGGKLKIGNGKGEDKRLKGLTIGAQQASGLSKSSLKLCTHVTKAPRQAEIMHERCDCLRLLSRTLQSSIYLVHLSRFPLPLLVLLALVYLFSCSLVRSPLLPSISVPFVLFAVTHVYFLSARPYLPLYLPTSSLPSLLPPFISVLFVLAVLCMSFLP